MLSMLQEQVDFLGRPAFQRLHCSIRSHADVQSPALQAATSYWLVQLGIKNQFMSLRLVAG